MLNKIKRWLGIPIVPDVEEYNGFKRYSTAHPEYLRRLREEIKKRGAVYVHTRY